LPRVKADQDAQVAVLQDLYGDKFAKTLKVIYNTTFNADPDKWQAAVEAATAAHGQNGRTGGRGIHRRTSRSGGSSYNDSGYDSSTSAGGGSGSGKGYRSNFKKSKQKNNRSGGGADGGTSGGSGGGDGRRNCPFVVFNGRSHFGQPFLVYHVTKLYFYAFEC
jgi:hypothetical protein